MIELRELGDRDIEETIETENELRNSNSISCLFSVSQVQSLSIILLIEELHSAMLYNDRIGRDRMNQ